MGEKKKSAKSPFVWGRIIVIVYAAGVVAIGLAPFQKEYRGIKQLLTSSSEKMAKQPKRTRADDERRSAAIPELPPVKMVGRSKERPVDSITDSDRTQLNSFVDGL